MSRTAPRHPNNTPPMEPLPLLPPELQLEILARGDFATVLGFCEALSPPQRALFIGPAADPTWRARLERDLGGFSRPYGSLADYGAANGGGPASFPTWFVAWVEAADHLGAFGRAADESERCGIIARVARLGRLELAAWMLRAIGGTRDKAARSAAALVEAGRRDVSSLTSLDVEMMMARLSIT